MTVIQREVRKRGLFGRLFKWAFIGFNLLMAVWLIGYWVSIGEMSAGLTDEYEQAGAAIGATLGTGMIVGLWMAGAVILGLFVLLTRGQKILITEDRE
jgi:hypothetical protein